MLQDTVNPGLKRAPLGEPRQRKGSGETGHLSIKKGPFGGPFFERVFPLANQVLELFAGAEVRNLAGRDVDLLLGPRVAAGAGLPLGDEEGAEADEGHTLALLHGALDAVDDGIEGLASLALGESGLAGDAIDEVLLGHLSPLGWRRFRACLVLWELRLPGRVESEPGLTACETLFKARLRLSATDGATINRLSKACQEKNLEKAAPSARLGG